jgi:hypothetical protein
LSEFFKAKTVRLGYLMAIRKLPIPQPKFFRQRKKRKKESSLIRVAGMLSRFFWENTTRRVEIFSENPQGLTLIA